MEEAEIARMKKHAARKAVELVENGMILGLGTGSTASYTIEALAERVRDGLEILGIPTSQTTAELAKRLGVSLTDLETHPQIDLTIDGADEVETKTLNLIKGRGGALLREKIVACASKKLVIVADETKLVNRLASHCPIPVEIVPFGWNTTKARLEKLGAKAELRGDNNHRPFFTDGGHYILDCTFKSIVHPERIANELSSTVGVVETGLFLDLANLVIVAKSTGLEIYRKLGNQVKLLSHLG